MKNIFVETANPVTRAEIIKMMEDLGIVLPEEMIEHYLEYNGGGPLRATYKWADGGKTEIDHFSSMVHEQFTSFEEIYNDLLIIENVLPKGFAPFALDHGGNMFCICTLPENYNEVFYANMDHYDPNDPNEYLMKVSPSFNKFVDELI